MLITFCKPFFRALYQKYNLVQCHIRIALLSGSEGLRATTPYFDYFTVHEYENIDLPCLASHPSIEVILMKVRIRMKMTWTVRVIWETLHKNRPLIAASALRGWVEVVRIWFHTKYGQGRRESEAKNFANFYLLCCIYLFYGEITATAHDIGKRAISSEWVMPVCIWIFIAHNIVSTVDVTNTGWWRKNSLTQVRKSAHGWYGCVDSTK